MIDPGHGGKDPGAWKGTRSRMPEKSIVLDIGNSVSKTLRDRGASVIATRTTDTYPTLDQRANAADRYRVDLFVSIHADSAPKNPAASGTEIHIQDGPGGNSLIAARCIIASIKKAGLECRGLQSSNLHVLREHRRPAILIECGFLTNRGDALKLNSSAYRARLAAAIADGITDYFSR
jgi:N-acetylmuramoyl-L-alanine amidase